MRHGRRRFDADDASYTSAHLLGIVGFSRNHAAALAAASSSSFSVPPCGCDIFRHMEIVARGIADVPLLVCDPRTWREHPELFHYTGAHAFASIVRSNSFWASHYQDMDDTKEVLRLRTALPPAIAARYDEIVGAFKTDRTARRLWKKGGGGLGTARDFVNGLYGATFDKKAPTGLDAFVTSFSTRAGDGDFEREHGVWSQWRDYAGPDGYCIVLDTKCPSGGFLIL
jgi:hypothetical protein